MKITDIKGIQIETPRYYGQISGHVILEVHTDEGVVGLGEASDSQSKDLGRIVPRLKELLVGRDPTRINEIHETMRVQRFESTVTDLHWTSAVDIALHDLNGKVQGVSVAQLLGGKVRDRMYCCYPIFGWQVTEDYDRAASYLDRLTDLGHHLFRYYVSGDSELDNRFLTEVKDRHGDRIRLKSIDFSGRFTKWDEAIRYAAELRHHDPYHFEQPSGDLRVCTEFTKRMDLPVSMHIGDPQYAFEVIDRGACNVFNLACVYWGPTNIRKLFAIAEAAGIKCLIGTDQESTLGTSMQVQIGCAMPNLDLPCDPMGPVLYNDSPAKERIRAEGSYLYPPEGPGLGVELDEAKFEALTTSRA